MKIFRKLYYKLVTLLCLVSTFILLINFEKGGIGYGVFYLFTGALCFGSWSVGKEEIDPDKPIRNVLMLLAWSFLGFGIMAMGIVSLNVDPKANNSLLSAFLTMTFLVLIIVYVVAIIKNKDLYAILSVVLFILGCVVAGFSNGIFILGLLSLLIFLSAIVFFILSFIKGVAND